MLPRSISSSFIGARTFPPGGKSKDFPERDMHFEKGVSKKALAMRYLLCFSMLLCFCNTPAVGAQPPGNVIVYTPSDANIPNPERGFYHQDAPLWLGTERSPQEVDTLRSLGAGG